MATESEDYLEELTHAAAITVLASVLGRPREEVKADPAGAMLEKLGQLPSGKIRREKDRLVVKGMTWLLEDVPNEHARRRELEERIADALHRSR